MPSCTGFAAAAPTPPRPGTAVPLVITPTRFPRAVYRYDAAASPAISEAGKVAPGR